jgi:hypothetical protein
MEHQSVAHWFFSSISAVINKQTLCIRLVAWKVFPSADRLWDSPNLPSIVYLVYWFLYNAADLSRGRSEDVKNLWSLTFPPSYVLCLAKYMDYFTGPQVYFPPQLCTLSLNSGPQKGDMKQFPSWDCLWFWSELSPVALCSVHVYRCTFVFVVVSLPLYSTTAQQLCHPISLYPVPENFPK